MSVQGLLTANLINEQFVSCFSLRKAVPLDTDELWTLANLVGGESKKIIGSIIGLLTC